MSVQNFYEVDKSFIHSHIATFIFRCNLWVYDVVGKKTQVLVNHHLFYWIVVGIPISQQHLIWQTHELDDDYCLHDYEIHNGATLKLVLAMRGGPINTRRGKRPTTTVLVPCFPCMLLWVAWLVRKNLWNIIPDSKPKEKPTYRHQPWFLKCSTSLENWLYFGKYFTSEAILGKLASGSRNNKESNLKFVMGQIVRIFFCL